MNNSNASTGTGSFSGDILALLLLIVGGTVAAVWISTLPHEARIDLLHRSFNFTTLVMAQPGVFLAARIANSDKMPWKKKLVLVLIVFAVLACAIPSAIAYWMYPAVEQAFL